MSPAAGFFEAANAFEQACLACLFFSDKVVPCVSAAEVTLHVKKESFCLQWWPLLIPFGGLGAPKDAMGSQQKLRAVRPGSPVAALSRRLRECFGSSR